MGYDESINDDWGWAKQWKHNEGLAGMEGAPGWDKWVRMGTGFGAHVPEGVDPKRWYGSQGANFLLGPGWGSVVNFPYAKAGKAIYNMLKPGESPRNKRLREAEEEKAGGGLLGVSAAPGGEAAPSWTDDPALAAAVADALEPYDPGQGESMTSSDQGFWDRVADSTGPSGTPQQGPPPSSRQMDADIASMAGDFWGYDPNTQPPEGYQMAKSGAVYDPNVPTVAVPGFGEGNIGGPGSGTYLGGRPEGFRGSLNDILGSNMGDRMYGLENIGAGGGVHVPQQLWAF